MSNPTGESKDVFTVCKQNVEKFFSEVKKSTPRYQLSVATLQQDYVEAWKNVINSAIALEQEYAIKTGLNTNVPEATLKTIRDITEKAIKAFNENTKSFASLNRNIMDSVMSVFQQKSKT